MKMFNDNTCSIVYKHTPSVADQIVGFSYTLIIDDITSPWLLPPKHLKTHNSPFHSPVLVNAAIQ